MVIIKLQHSFRNNDRSKKKGPILMFSVITPNFHDNVFAPNN